MQEDLDRVQSSISRLLQGKTVIPVVETSKITRPVRLILDGEEWKKNLKKQEKELKIKNPKRIKSFIPKLKQYKRQITHKESPRELKRNKKDEDEDEGENEKEDEEVDILLFD